MGSKSIFAPSKPQSDSPHQASIFIFFSTSSLHLSFGFNQLPVYIKLFSFLRLFQSLTSTSSSNFFNLLTWLKFLLPQQTIKSILSLNLSIRIKIKNTEFISLQRPQSSRVVQSWKKRRSFCSRSDLSPSIETAPTPAALQPMGPSHSKINQRLLPIRAVEQLRSERLPSLGQTPPLQMQRLQPLLQFHAQDIHQGLLINIKPLNQRFNYPNRSPHSSIAATSLQRSPPCLYSRQHCYRTT